MRKPNNRATLPSKDQKRQQRFIYSVELSKKPSRRSATAVSSILFGGSSTASNSGASTLILYVNYSMAHHTHIRKHASMYEVYWRSFRRRTILSLLWFLVVNKRGFLRIRRNTRCASLESEHNNNSYIVLWYVNYTTAACCTYARSLCIRMVYI